MRRTLALVLASVSLIACEQKAATSDSANVALAGAADGPRVVTVTAKDFAFLAPDTIAAGMTTFKLKNEGTTFHHVVLARLDSGKTMGELMTAMKNPGPPPAWMVMIGGPNAPDPHGESNATLDVAAGNYVLLCFVDLPGKVPHFAKGMVKALTVTPSSQPTAAAPVADATISLSDYAFTISKPLSAGSHTFQVVNTAKQPHEVELIKFAPGKTMKDLGDWMQSMKGPPPGSGVGGTTPSTGGAPVYFTADITPGDYLLICFLPAPDGKAHFEHGMALTFTVK